jgi:predicted ABC-type ATPase
MSRQTQVIVIAGPNGAGKSTIAPDIVRKAFGVESFVNADTIARGLSEADVRRRYERSIRNFFNIYRQIADSWVMLDNSSAAAPRSVAWRNPGGPLHIVRSGPWEQLRNSYEQDFLQDR